MYRTRAALADSATEFAPDQSCFIAKHPQQWHVGLRLNRGLFFVNF
jgi:hypothetical protein